MPDSVEFGDRTTVLVSMAIVVNGGFTLVLLYGMAYKHVMGDAVLGDLVVPMFATMLVGVPLSGITLIVLLKQSLWKYACVVSAVSILPVITLSMLLFGPGFSPG